MNNSSFRCRREKPLNTLLKVVTKDGQWCSLPMGLAVLHKRQTRTPASLFELTLRKFYTTLWGHFLEQCLMHYLPRVVYQYLLNGPIGHCNNIYCVTSVFRECYFSVLQRQHERAPKFTYTAIFCSKECTEMWLWQNSSIYKDIEWGLEQDYQEEDDDILL